MKLAALKILRLGGPYEQRTLAALADQTPEVVEIEVDKLLIQMGEPEENLKRGNARRNVTRVLRAIANHGFGQLIPGRKGHKSRFVGNIPLAKIGLAATSDSTSTPISGLSDADGTPFDSGGEESHRIMVRPGWPIELPADMTRSEAERLIKLIENLPNE